MSNYTKTTNFTAKDSLPSGNASKKVLGAEIDDEFDAISTAIATKAVITEGTSCSQSPVAGDTTTTQAHGLAQVPDLLVARLVCLTAEYGYSIGDEVDLSSDIANGTVSIIANTTNVIVRTRSGISASIQVVNRSTGSASPITLANWKIVVVPYKFGT